MAIGWQHYECTLEEDTVEGVRQIAPAAASGPCEIIKQHVPKAKRIIRWVAAAQAGNVKDLPEIPAAMQFADATLEARVLGTHSPIPVTRGLYLYIIWGSYTYAMINARPADADFPIPNLPPSISNLGDAAQQFPAAKFQRFLSTGSFYPTPKIS